MESVFAAFTDEEQIDDLVKGVEYPDATLDLIFRFTRSLAIGTWKDRVSLDRDISGTIPDYDFNRLAAIDRNILRLAFYELREVPYIPPAVTINEAIEMAKKYSTAESGKFVNGVLSSLLKTTEKANYDPSNFPNDPDLGEMERIFNAPAPIIDEETVDANSDDGKIATRYGIWKLKTDEVQA